MEAVAKLNSKVRDEVHLDQDLLKRIASIDLECIKIKLMHSEDGVSWSRSQADQVERLYRRFLYMVVQCDKRIVPTKLVDKFWHAHILDTEKYAEDCETAFGYFIHHFPYFGLRGAEDKTALHRAFQEVCSLYMTLFGEEYTSVGPVDCDSCHPKCDGPVGCRGDDIARCDRTEGSEVRPSFAMLDMG